MDRNPSLEMHPVNFTNDPALAGLNDNLIAINATMQIDLLGQCGSESLGHAPYSGTGGQSDFVRAANRSRGGKAFIVLPSTAKGDTISRIVPSLSPGTHVSTSKNDINYVVTEYGVAQLRGKSAKQRAQELIAIAHPDFRAELTEQAVRIDVRRAFAAARHDDAARPPRQQGTPVVAALDVAISTISISISIAIAEGRPQFVLVGQEEMHAPREFRRNRARRGGRQQEGLAETMCEFGGFHRGRARDAQLGEHHVALGEQRLGGAHVGGSQAVVGTRHHGDGAFAPAREHGGGAGGRVGCHRHVIGTHALGAQMCEQLVPFGIVASAADEPGLGAQARGRHRLVGALAAGCAPKTLPAQRLAIARQAGRLEHVVHVDAAYDQQASHACLFLFSLHRGFARRGKYAASNTNINGQIKRDFPEVIFEFVRIEMFE
jgi:hypothetical protein